MDIFKTYQEWKHKSKKSEALKEANKMLSEAFFVAGPPPMDGGEDQGAPVVTLNAGAPADDRVKACFRSQASLIQLSEILFKIEGLQRLYRKFSDQDGSEASMNKLKGILESLFELSHMKLDEAKNAFFPEGDEPKDDGKMEPEVEEPETAPDVTSVTPMEEEPKASMGAAAPDMNKTVSVV